MSKNKSYKIFRESFLYNLICGTIFSAFALICIFPFYHLLISTISDSQFVEQGRIYLFPVGLTLNNYIEVLRIPNLGNAAFISISRTILGTSGTVFVTSYLAYFFTKTNMWGRKFWYRLVVATMYFSAGLIPSFLNNRMLGLHNNFLIYIVPGLVGVFNMVLVKTSIEAMPAEIEESVIMDGAGYLTRYFRIVLPLQIPILATIAVFSAVGHWNDFFTTQLYITRPQLFTLQFLLFEFLNQVRQAMRQIDTAAEGMGMAGNVLRPASVRLTLTAVVTIPILLVYPFMQKYFVKGIMVGAIKG